MNYKPYKTIEDQELECTWVIAKINEKEIDMDSSVLNEYGHIRIYNWVDAHMF